MFPEYTVTDLGDCLGKSQILVSVASAQGYLLGALEW